MSESIASCESEAVPMLTAAASPLTPLAHSLGGGALTACQGARTIAVFSDAAAELSALAQQAAVFDRGQRVRLRIAGDDRVRWLNGMVTNTVKALTPGTHNYTFILNAQGRIQGDATILAFADHLLLETDRSQAEHLFAHLDRFIIMDDVELAWVKDVPGSASRSSTTLGLAGPGAESLLALLGLPTPASGTFAETSSGAATVVVAEHSSSVRRFSLWVAEPLPLWEQLLGSGVVAAGAFAVDALRVLEGMPLYGIDITEKTLAQETGQMQALNFNKGCYLGQEIVERVRSRATVHRGLRQFFLHGASAKPGTPLTADGVAIGELTSIASVPLPSGGYAALGLVRIEALKGTLTYQGGVAQVPAHSLLGELASYTHQGKRI